MPLKPHKGESQSDFMARCMHELGQSDTKRPQDQKVAICMDSWRAAHGGKKPKKTIQEYIARWKEIYPNLKGALDDADLPEPEPGQDYDDFMNECVNEVSAVFEDVDEEEIEDACNSQWEMFEADANEESGSTDLVVKMHAESRIDKGMEFILSDATPDRFGDIIEPKGWQFNNFMRNPIALFNHNSDFPVGKWKNIRVRDNALRGELTLAPEGTSARIDEIRKLIDAGILKAVSVGFKALEKKSLKENAQGMDAFFGPFRYVKSELVECSLVSIPANPNALAVAKSLNISSETQELVFGEHASKQMSRRVFTSRRRGEHADKRSNGKSHGEHAETHRNRRDSAMSLSQRITDTQARIVALRDKLTEHLGNIDDSNVTDKDLELTSELNSKLAQENKTLAALQESERHLGATATDGSGEHRQMTVRAEQRGNGSAQDGRFFATPGSKKLQPLDYLVRAGVVTYLSKVFNRTPEEMRTRIPGYNDENTRIACDLIIRAATAPAQTTVAGWAAELVQTVYAAYMDLLYPKAIMPRLAAKGLALGFGRAGRIVIPMRSATPTIAGSFVGEGLPIPVRQGAFTSQTLTPKKMAVITTWTREIDEHSIPAIEGLLRDAIQVDTGIAIDSVLIDANAATAVRPAGILNGVGATTATAGGGVAAIVGDIKSLTNALITATKGNVRSPVWLMNPGDINNARLAYVTNTGVFPFKAELDAGTLNGIPYIDSGTVPLHTVVLLDAADFVVVGGDTPRFEVSDQATLHEEDTTPLPIASPGTPATVAAPVRSLWQTDSLALRMILPLNWVLRRTGMVSWTQSVTW